MARFSFLEQLLRYFSLYMEIFFPDRSLLSRFSFPTHRYSRFSGLSIGEPNTVQLTTLNASKSNEHRSLIGFRDADL